MGWQVTATTVHCDVVEDYVTLLIYYDDWRSECAHYKKHFEAWEKAKGKKRKELKRCDGPSSCTILSGYRDKLMKEEAEAAGV